jgi:hypothetical protein
LSVEAQLFDVNEQPIICSPALLPPCTFDEDCQGADINDSIDNACMAFGCIPAGVCGPSLATDCDDNDPCTIDFCDFEIGGCQNNPMDDCP